MELRVKPQSHKNMTTWKRWTKGLAPIEDCSLRQPPRWHAGMSGREGWSTLGSWTNWEPRLKNKPSHCPSLQGHWLGAKMEPWAGFTDALQVSLCLSLLHLTAIWKNQLWQSLAQTWRQMDLHQCRVTEARAWRWHPEDKLSLREGHVCSESRWSRVGCGVWAVQTSGAQL